MAKSKNHYSRADIGKLFHFKKRERNRETDSLIPEPGRQEDHCPFRDHAVFVTHSKAPSYKGPRMGNTLRRDRGHLPAI